jgi:Mg-chelatase subunit ChlI
VAALLLSVAVAQQPTPVAPPAPEPTGTGAEQPLASVAKKKQNSKGKRVITEDDMDAAANLLPRIRMDDAENSDEIIAAIGRYKLTHSPEETEAAVQGWYERYDQDLAAAIRQNQAVNTLREENWSNGNEICRESANYQNCESRRRAEYIGQRHDQLTIQNNVAMEVRIQHVFMKVRNGMLRYNLRYEWFKIRTTNGIDTY